MWGMTFEKSLRMFSPGHIEQAERECHKRIAAGIGETLKLMRQIENNLEGKTNMTDDNILKGNPNVKPISVEWHVDNTGAVLVFNNELTPEEKVEFEKLLLKEVERDEFVFSPCPFCGTQPDTHSYESEGRTYAWVKCTPCRLQRTLNVESLGQRRLVIAAVCDWWNRRATVLPAFNRLDAVAVELLSVAAEEANELGQAVTKILRHGFDSFNPNVPPSKQHSNRAHLEKEAGDLLTAIRLLAQKGFIEMEEVEMHARRKLKELPQWLHHAKI